jgi:hypothetical protein
LSAAVEGFLLWEFSHTLAVPDGFPVSLQRAGRGGRIRFVKFFTIFACQKFLGAYIGRPLKIGTKRSKRRKRNVEFV